MSNQQLTNEERREMRRREKIAAEHRKVWKRFARRVAIYLFLLIAGGGLVWGLIQVVPKAVSNKSPKASVGDVAPDFTLPATTGESVTLSQFRGKKNVLLYFHEGLTCDPCIQQMPELEKSLDEFEKMNVTLFSLALDPPDKLKQAAEQYGMKTPILSYGSAKTEVDYTLLPFSMGMGRRAGHTFVLVGTDGVVKWRKDYWPGRGHMVRGGTMFVDSGEIVANVKTVFGQ